MPAGLIAIITLAGLALVTLLAAVATDVQQHGWKNALISLGAFAAAVAGFAALMMFVIARP